VSIESIEPIILAGIASAMLFPWRVVTRRKCNSCGVRTPRRDACQMCSTSEAV
jgi:hypothetical protein